MNQRRSSLQLLWKESRQLLPLMLILVGVQLMISWVVMRVLEGLNQSYDSDGVLGTPDTSAVTVDNGVLSIAGERHNETESQEEGVKRIERFTGRFYRRFTLPDTANTLVPLLCSVPMPAYQAPPFMMMGGTLA